MRNEIACVCSWVACFQIGNSQSLHSYYHHTLLSLTKYYVCFLLGFSMALEVWPLHTAVDASFISVQLIRTSCLNTLQWTSPTVVQWRCDDMHNPNTNVQWWHAHHYHCPTTTRWTTTPPPLTTATTSPPAPALATPTTFPAHCLMMMCPPPIIIQQRWWWPSPSSPSPPLSNNNNEPHCNGSVFFFLSNLRLDYILSYCM